MRSRLIALSVAALLALPAAIPRPTAAAEEPKPAAAAGSPEAGAAEKVKTREVKLETLTLHIPETWKQGQPTSRLRLGEFKIPAAQGDEDEEVELTIFSFGGGGSVRQNVERWINQFDAAGRKTKVTRGESAQGQYVLVDVSGTYHKPVGPPVLQRTERLPDARMLAVILAVKDEGVYYLKLAGPKKTVSENAGHLRRAFGGDAEKEQPLDLDGDANESE